MAMVNNGPGKIKPGADAISIPIFYKYKSYSGERYYRVISYSKKFNHYDVESVCLDDNGGPHRYDGKTYTDLDDKYTPISRRDFYEAKAKMGKAMLADCEDALSETAPPTEPTPITDEAPPPKPKMSFLSILKHILPGGTK